ncbi:zinc finger protein 91-like [Plodia interpunctella]|uniref:zinc finger protein 91-like n=1 Tax=Plodia interpunctella TaxID=58824 RepID=UPI002367B849|nr:zinc finger protein 91-like [Plodia interpunctella]
MLQQMSSQPGTLVGEVARIVRPLEGRSYGDASSEASSDAAEEDLPQCKIRRNYNCAKCKFYTQNPRVFLLHVRDVHFERFKIYVCPYCVYASRHHQKLLRHLKMMHDNRGSLTKFEPELPTAPQTILPMPVSVAPAPSTMSEERMEDLLEEVEECDDGAMDAEDGHADPTFRSTDVEMDVGRTADGSKKGDYFNCDKCNYVTHIKARFTKHVKYHSIPRIKCSICEFRTPYKWNLDRHMKNHGGNGSFNCCMCNFTADIKQSLTAHEMNHHSRPLDQSAGRRGRSRVGAGDVSARVSLAKEEEGSGDSRSSHSEMMGMQYIERDTISCNSDSNDASTSEGAAKKDNSQLAQDAQYSPNADDAKSQKQNRKIPRPIPQLIPLNASTPSQAKSTGEPPSKKFKENPSNESNDSNSDKLDALPADITLIPVSNTSSKETVVRKKNESFFDRLKERILTETGDEGSLNCKNCGFVSKCLSEHSVHEKTCTVQSNRAAVNTLLPNSSSTRCQNCRHRCKSSADLYIHMQTCRKNEKRDDQSVELKNQESNDTSSSNQDRDAEPHPMENVVFVWNNINHDANNFETPLGININDDSTLPILHKTLDNDIADDNESMNLSPSQAVGKRVFKCPHCPFWASTASRFHVHIVGHLNKKPFECSLCKYKSNWRWDITKHIKLKSARDPEHNEAKVLMTDETGRRNYTKYSKFLAMSVLNEYGENEFHYVDQNTSADPSIEGHESVSISDINEMNASFDMQPMNLQTQHYQLKYDFIEGKIVDAKKPKKTLWKCKKCNYKDPSKDALLEHVREHAKAESSNPQNKKPDNLPDPADLAYRCGHCNQLSNWKHVIQRHCRLKHDGIIKVITTIKPKPETSSTAEITGDTCTKCPYRSSDRKLLMMHLKRHQPSHDSIFKCYFCPYFVKDEQELIQHLLLHGITEPEEYIAKAMGSRSPLPEPVLLPSTSGTSNKRHKCTECPYETNSKSQYMYHEQFHRAPNETREYKCPECNYSVSKRHLLNQHLRVHGIVTKKSESEAELEAMVSEPNKTEKSQDDFTLLEEIPYVWVSAKNEFHKMYKCRFCSYVNSQKCKIPNHEKIHCIENSEITVYKCWECKFTCDNAGRLAEHSKTHGEIYGRIYCPVESEVPDEEQIAKLRKVIEIEKTSTSDELQKEDVITTEIKEIKTLHFCQKCPSRFFTEGELRAHDSNHNDNTCNKCKSCDFSAPDEEELDSHSTVHSDEYHTKTKMLKFIHNMHPAHTQPRLELVHCPTTSDITWIVSTSNKNFDPESNIRKSCDSKHPTKQYLCKECPAKFFKSSALSYHLGLHGSDGEHKCKKCNYAVKNIGNLAKHELLHESSENKQCGEYDSGDDMDYKNIPLSGTDLFQRKTEAQKRVLTDKDKLVKPNDHFPPVLQADPQFGYLMHGNPEFIYPTYLKNGRQKEKRYKCHKCPSAFEKREQYKIHLSLHGSKQRYKCELCDYSVKYYANYVQHMRKHQMNDEAQAERKKGTSGFIETGTQEAKQEEGGDNIKLAIKTMPRSTAKSDFQQFSISDQQTLRLLQRRRSINNSGKDPNANETSPPSNRKLHMCLLCPYTNQRQDALTNHYRRHDDTDVLYGGSHKCSYCDLVVVQSHFLREHLKTHFNYQKTITPDGFAANKDVSFTITQIDDENLSNDLKLDIRNKIYPCSKDEKIYVKISSGELMVE